MRGFGYAVYLLFICSWFLHLPARLPILGSIRFDLILICVLLAASLFTVAARREGTGENSTRRWLWILVIYAAVSIPLVEWPGSVLRSGFPQFFKAFVFFSFTATFVSTPQRLRWMLAVFLGCQIFRVLEPLYLNVTAGYWGAAASMADWEVLERLSGAPHDVVNPNGLAFIVLTTVPFLHYLTAGNVAGRILYISLLPLLLYTLLLTSSRSGLIGLVAIAALVWYRSRHKVLLAAAIAGAVAIVSPRLDANLADRYWSIVSEETRNAATAEGRVDGVKRDLQVALRRPLFGHGLGTSREANANYGSYDQPSHNLYAEVAQEMGACGLTIFLLFVVSLLRGLRRAAATLRTAPASPAVVRAAVPALQVWIGMNLLFSLASYGLSGYEWYLAAGLVDAVVRLADPHPIPSEGCRESIGTFEGRLQPVRV